MNELYEITIKHLEKIDTIKLNKNMIKNESDDNLKKRYVNNKKSLYGLKFIHDKYNNLPILDIGNLHNRRDKKEELEDFINLLKLLIKVDNIFLSLVEKYKDKNKEVRDYKDIRNALIEKIEIDFTDDFMDIKKSKLIIGLAIEDLFHNKYQRESAASMYLFFYNKIFTYISNYYDDFLNSLGEYYISKICNYDDTNTSISAKLFIEQGMSKGKDISELLNIEGSFIFLSYAFKDRFFSFLLYIEALEYGQTLYVDWMYNTDIDKTIELKSILGYFLKSADKMVFLQSIQSELNITPNFVENFKEKQKMIRQWCSWEIGYFYNKSRETPKPTQYCNHTFKYVMNSDVIYKFKKTIKIDNPILEDIKSIDSINKI